MLKRLSVENYALIESLDMQLDDHLNIITGQTGAGKSILLGALGLVLGNRADVAALLDQGRNCVVEGEFDVEGYGLEGFFEENDLDYDDAVVVRRVITPAGKSRAYVNDLPVSLAVLKELSGRLIDIHSQHQSLLVSDAAFRMRMVDGVAENGAIRAKYDALYGEWRTAERELTKAREEAEQSRKDEEYVRYQYEQLSTMNLREGELEELEAEQKELANVERIQEALGGSLESLNADEGGVVSALKNVVNALADVEDVYAPSAELARRTESTYIELKDIAAELADAVERIDANPQRLATVETRMDTLYSLIQKHRVADERELIELRDDYGRRLQLITDSGEHIATLERRAKECQEKASESAKVLTESRKKAGEKLQKGVMKMLGRLGMESARFVCEIAATDGLTASGADEICFMFASGSDAALRPLEKVASGGEISRVMLCLKALVAKSAKLPTIVFDEIDTGVSGRIADVTGEIIADLSESMQVLNITHLPQVASKGDTHFLVYKDSRTHIRKLTPQERVEEIANMLSGSSVTDAARQQARLLLGMEQ